MGATLRDRVSAQTYRAQAAWNQALTIIPGVRVPVYASRQEMGDDLRWVAYRTDTLGNLLFSGMPLPEFLAKRSLDVLRHPSVIADGVIDGKVKGEPQPRGDCEDWSAFIASGALGGWAQRAWLAMVRYDGRSKCHMFAEWQDRDGVWHGSNWRGGRAMPGRCSDAFATPPDLLVRWPVTLSRTQAVVLGRPELA